MTETEKFRTERLVARSWQVEDLPLAMELWGDPAVTALIDSRGKLTNTQVGEKLRAEIERVRWRSVLGAFRSPQWRVRRLRRASAVALYARRGEFRSRVPSREALLGQGLRNGSSVRRARIRLGKIAAVASLRRASSPQSCFGEILKKLGFELIGNVFYEPTGLMHPSSVCKAPPLEGCGFGLVVPAFSSCCVRPAFLRRISARLELDGFQRTARLRQGHR